MYNNYGYNPYFKPQFIPDNTNTLQYPQTPLKQGLNGKLVDSIDVVKAMEISLDGSINYFPLTDGSAIVSKQLQNDGTSKTIVYRPVNEEEVSVKYITKEDLEEAIKRIDYSDIEDELDDLRRELKELKKKKKEN